MKRSIIIVVLIASGILGLFIWIGRSKPLDKTLNSLQEEKATNLEKIKDSVLNVATLNIAIMVDDYYQKNSTETFEKDLASISKINNYLDGIKNEKGLEIEYYVHSTKANYVVKTRLKGLSSFYCLDTTTESVKSIIIQSASSFMATTDCKGVELE